MINRQLINATVIKYGGVDEYGQMLSTPEEQREIKMTFTLYNHTNSSDIRYQNVRYVGLTKDKDINDNMTIKVGEDEYKVLFVNPFGRMTQVFLV